MSQIVVSSETLQNFCSVLESSFMDCMDNRPEDESRFYFSRFLNHYYIGYIFRVVKHPLVQELGLTFPKKCQKLCQSYVSGEHSYTGTITLFRKALKDFLTSDAKELIPECDDYFTEEDE